MAYVMALLIFFQMGRFNVYFLWTGPNGFTSTNEDITDFVMELILSHFQILQQQFMIQYL